MKSTTLAAQQATMAAGARPCHGLALGHQWSNAAVAMAGSTYGFIRTISTKRPARHLGGLPT